MARPVCTAGSRRPCAPIDWHASLSAVLHATLQSPMPADRPCPTGCGTTATGTTSGSRSASGAAPAFHTRHPPSLAPVPRRSTPRPRSGTPHRSSTARRSARGALPGGRCGRPRRYERRRRRGSVRNHRAPGARAGVGNARRQTAPPAAAPRPARPAALRPAGSDAAVAAAAATAVAPSHRWVWRRPPHPPPRAAAPPAAAAGRSVGHLRWWRAWGEGECVRSTRHGWPS